MGLNNSLHDRYATSIQAIYDRIQILYKDANAVFMDIDMPELKVRDLKNPTGQRNIFTYLWTIQEMIDLQNVLNHLIEVYNSYSLIDVLSGKPTDYIELWIPVMDLTLDKDYEAKMNNNFKLANKILDQLFEYIKPYKKG